MKTETEIMLIQSVMAGLIGLLGGFLLASYWHNIVCYMMNVSIFSLGLLFGILIGVVADGGIIDLIKKRRRKK